LGATGLTAFLAIVGKSRPGTFLRLSAYLSVGVIAAEAVDGYGKRTVNRAVFKLDNVDPKPGKLWERTKHWTVDDMVVGGGVVGTFLALNPGAFPGARGWKRFLGIASAGCALGGVIGQNTFPRVSPVLSAMMPATEVQIKNLHYDRLKQDAKAQETLTRFGKAALAFYTLPLWRLSTNPFKAGAASHGMADGGFSTSEDPRASLAQQEDMTQYALVSVEFNHGELTGPDLQEGCRTYKDRPADRNSSDLEERLEHLQELRRVTSSEARYTRSHLAKREREFYNLQTDDKETEIVRRELQMLNNMALSLTLRDVIYAYHIADMQRRLEQIDQKDRLVQEPMPDLPLAQADLPEDWKIRHSPHLAMEQVRLTWTRQKEVLGMLEQSAAMYADLKPEPGTPHENQLNQIRLAMENMKINVEATGRLLKDFEDKIREADENADKSQKPSDE
jgi:hypothetical protein